MIISEVVLGVRFKTLLKYMYNWGILVAITGGIALLYDLGEGRLLIAIGGILVGLVFFFHGFTPVREEFDWSLAFPELNGINPTRNEIAVEDINRFKIDLENIKKEMEDLRKGLLIINKNHS
jgi:hypothetical protein